MYQMRKNNCFYFGSYFLFLISQSVYAEDIATTAYIQQQQRNEALQQQIQPKDDVNLQKNIPSDHHQLQYLKSHSEATCFPIQKIKLIGQDASTFQFALNHYIYDQQSVLGRCLGVQGLNQLVDLVQNKIIQQGYVTTRVLLPQQNIKSGIVNLEIIPGRVDQVHFEEGTSKRAHKFNALPVHTGDLLNIRDIEQGLENLRRVPTVNANFKIAPATQHTEPGYSDVIISWQQSKPYRINLSVDDAGSTSTGKYQGTATLSLDHLMTLNDLFYVSFNHNLETKNQKDHGTQGLYLSYTLPWNYWLLSTNYNNSNYTQTVVGANQDYQYRGKNEQVTVDLSRIIYRDARRKTSIGMGGWVRSSHNFINDTEIEVQQRRTSGWQAHIDHNEYFSNATLTTNLTYKRGTAAFHALAAPEEFFNEASSRVGFWQANTSLTMPFIAMDKPLQYSLQWRWQHSNRSLTPQDRFSIGSRYTVRGFDGEQTLLDDNGFLLRHEMNGPFFYPNQQWYVGIDYGEVSPSKQADRVAMYSDMTLMGSVFGLRGQLPVIGLNYDAFIGTPLKKPQRMNVDPYITGFSLSWSF